MSDEVPEGWVRVPLVDVAEVNPRHPKGLSDSLQVSFATMAALSESSPEFRFLEARPLGEVRNGFTHFAEGDVLFAKITPCMENGKGAIAMGLRNGVGCGTTELHVLRPLGGIHPSYLYHFLAQPAVRREAKENFTGTAGQARVPTDFIRRLPIPLAPLSEQRRIVTKLEGVLRKVSACQKRLAKIPALLNHLRQSVLAAACSGRLTADWRERNPDAASATKLVEQLSEAHEQAGGHRRGNAAPATEDVHDLTKSNFPGGWELSDLRNLVEPERPITYGILKPGPDTPQGVPYVRVINFPNDKLDPSNLRRTSKEIDAAYARARLREGDILLSIRGTVGRVCIVPKQLTSANITQDSARLTIQDRMDRRFVAWFLRAPQTQDRMQRAIKGVAIRGINIGDVRALQVPIPPLREQKEIIKRIEGLLGLADHIEARFSKARRQIEQLKASLLAGAFRGELVPTEAELAQAKGRDYESACALLERIRAARAVAEPIASPKGRPERRRPRVRLRVARRMQR